MAEVSWRLAETALPGRCDPALRGLTPVVLRLAGLDEAEASRLRDAVKAEPGVSSLDPAMLQGSLGALRRLADRLDGAVGEAVRAALAAWEGVPPPAECGPATFRWGERTYVMGIVNLSPDSFSGDGLGADPDAALEQALRFQSEGADIVDVGAESTRPGAQPLTAEEEKRRLLPVVQRLARSLRIPISVDTYKAEVARAALAAGAHAVNDVWGLQRDPSLAEAVAAYGATLILMHNRAAAPTVTALGGHYAAVEYADLLGEVVAELATSVAAARAAGVGETRIWIDPGIGFGKTREQNLALLRHLRALRSLGRPLLVGTSRKSVIGLTLDLPVHERLEGTAATVALAVWAGADVVRVHDVRAMARVARLADAVCRGWSGRR